MTYLAWQINDKNEPLPESIQKALKYHEKKYGKVPNIVEYSDRLKDVQPIDGLRLVPVHIPFNLLLISVE